MTRIIIEVDELSDEEIKDLDYLLSDALGEFRSTRGDVDAYMNRRYPATTSCDCHDGRFGQPWENCPDCKGQGVRKLYSDGFLDNKRAEVTRRLALAKKLLMAQVRCPKIER